MQGQSFGEIVERALKEQYPGRYKKTASQKYLAKASPKSQGEETFWFQIRHASKLPLPERQQRLVPGRKWAVDFVWRKQKIVFEIEGGTWTNGRHSRGYGFQNDIRKYEALRKLGYQVFRYTTEMVLKGEALRDAETLLS